MFTTFYGYVYLSCTAASPHLPPIEEEVDWEVLSDVSSSSSSFRFSDEDDASSHNGKRTLSYVFIGAGTRAVAPPTKLLGSN